MSLFGYNSPSELPVQHVRNGPPAPDIPSECPDSCCFRPDYPRSGSAGCRRWTGTFDPQRKCSGFCWRLDFATPVDQGLPACFSICLPNRKSYSYRRARFHARQIGDRSAVGFGDLTHQRQAEAISLHIRFARGADVRQALGAARPAATQQTHGATLSAIGVG